MKTIEEKAQAYEKAIERAKKLYKDAIILQLEQDIKDYEYIFPELKEDNDDRIRKELVFYLGDMPEDTELRNGVTNRDVLAWLEKQKSEPNWCHHKVDLSSCSEEYRNAYYDGWNNCNMQHSQCESRKSDVLKCLINGMKFFYEDNEEATWGTEKFSMKVKDILYWLEKQGEQILANSAKTCKNEKNPADKVEPKFKVGDIIMPKDGGHEPWQIMQVDILDKKYRFKDGYVIHFSQEDDYELVEQDYAWSEEDELTRNALLNLVEMYYGCFNKEEKNRLLDWLKSLKDRVQPQWKPKDIHLEALRCVINGNNLDVIALKDLLEQLKKL